MRLYSSKIHPLMQRKKRKDSKSKQAGHDLSIPGGSATDKADRGPKLVVI